MISKSKLSNEFETLGSGLESSDLDRFAEVGNELADAAGEVIRKYFRKSFDILDKDDLSKFGESEVWGVILCCDCIIVCDGFGLGPVTIADKTAEESMVSIIRANFPSHAM